MNTFKILLFLLATFAFSTSAFSAEVFFYDTDNVGTPVAMWDTKGNKVWEGEYYPFGQEFRVSESPQKNDQRFIGKERDQETGLTNIGVRYFDEGSGRFLQPDPVRPVDPFTSKTNIALLSDPQRLNRYAYGLNNPYKYVDPDGEFAFLIPIVIVSGEALGGIAGHVLGASIVAGTAAWMMHEGNNENADASKGGEDFVVQPDGTTVDVNATPKGSYDQPDGGRTDILQKDDHGAGQSHTHEPIVNVNKKTGQKWINGQTEPGRTVSAQDVKNIKLGRARPSKPKRR